MTVVSVKSCFDPEAHSARGLSLDLLWALVSCCIAVPAQGAAGGRTAMCPGDGGVSHLLSRARLCICQPKLQMQEQNPGCKASGVGAAAPPAGCPQERLVMAWRSSAPQPQVLACNHALSAKLLASNPAKCFVLLTRTIEISFPARHWFICTFICTDAAHLLYLTVTDTSP